MVTSNDLSTVNIINLAGKVSQNLTFEGKSLSDVSIYKNSLYILHEDMIDILVFVNGAPKILYTIDAQYVKNWGLDADWKPKRMHVNENYDNLLVVRLETKIVVISLSSAPVLISIFDAQWNLE